MFLCASWTPDYEEDAMSMNRLILFSIITAITAGVFAGACGDNESDASDQESTGQDTGTASDTIPVSDSGAGTDPGGTSDAGADAGGEEACLASITGQVLKNGTEVIAAQMVVCIGELCFNPPASTDADGYFLWEYPRSDEEPCVSHDFREEWLHIQIFPAELEIRLDYATYSFVRHPTQAEISNEGETDYNLDLGMLPLYELPEESATYDPATGASVDLFGLSFELPQNGLIKRPRATDEDQPIEHQQEIRVFKAPLDVWNPPFVETKPDALYYIAPRWAKIADPGAQLTIEPPAGWVDGDTGILHLLGAWTSAYKVDEGPMKSEYVYRDENGRCINTDDDSSVEQVHDGFFTECGTAEMRDGRVVTSSIPRFSWVAISKQ